MNRTADLISQLEETARSNWGDWGWKSALSEEYQALLRADGVEQEFNTCRSTVNRVFSRRTCNADTLCYLAAAIGLRVTLQK